MQAKDIINTFYIEISFPLYLNDFNSFDDFNGFSKTIEIHYSINKIKLKLTIHM